MSYSVGFQIGPLAREADRQQPYEEEIGGNYQNSTPVEKKEFEEIVGTEYLH